MMKCEDDVCELHGGDDDEDDGADDLKGWVVVVRELNFHQLPELM